jgi:hypothetical protein
MTTNLNNAIRIALEPLRMVFYTALSTMDYAYLNSTQVPNPFIAPCRLLSISNNTNQDIYISFDAVNPHIYVAANGFIVRDYCTNRSDPGGSAVLSQGTQLYVVSVNAPTSGYVYAEVTYTTT